MQTILCVEDEAFVREDIVETLEDGGYNIVQASNGQEGLDALLKHKPDLILCDINMPNMNGNELLTKVRNEYPQFADMPFLFLTAFSDREDQLDGIELGVDDYLTKPIDFELLLAKIRQHLKQVTRMREKREREYVKLYQSFVGNIKDTFGKEKEQTFDMSAINIVILGEMSEELRKFNDILLRQKSNITIFIDENSYLREIKTLPIHFLFLWNYSNQQKNDLNQSVGKWKSKSIPVQVFPPDAELRDDVVSINSVDSVMNLPIHSTELAQKISRLLRQKTTQSKLL